MSALPKHKMTNVTHISKTIFFLSFFSYHKRLPPYFLNKYMGFKLSKVTHFIGPIWWSPSYTTTSFYENIINTLQETGYHQVQLLHLYVLMHAEPNVPARTCYSAWNWPRYQPSLVAYATLYCKWWSRPRVTQHLPKGINYLPNRRFQVEQPAIPNNLTTSHTQRKRMSQKKINLTNRHGILEASPQKNKSPN